MNKRKILSLSLVLLLVLSLYSVVDAFYGNNIRYNVNHRAKDHYYFNNGDQTSKDYHERRLQISRENLKQAKEEGLISKEDLKYWEEHLNKLDEDFLAGKYIIPCYYGCHRGSARNIEDLKSRLELAKKEGKLSKEDITYWESHIKRLEDNSYDYGNYGLNNCISRRHSGGHYVEYNNHHYRRNGRCR